MHIPSQLDPLVYWRQQRCRRWCACLVVGLLGFGLGREVVLAVRDWSHGPVTRIEWIAEQVEQMSRYSPTRRDLSKAKSLTTEDYVPWCYLPRRCLVTVPDGTWFHLVSHSYHDGERPLPPAWLSQLPFVRQLWPRASPNWVHDVIIAKCSDGAFYVNYGHVCGPISLNFDHPVATKTDFLASWAKQEHKHETWHQLRPAPQKR